MRVTRSSRPERIEPCRFPASWLGALLALGVAATVLTAQEGQRPAGWKVRADRPDVKLDELFFVTMTPGWHITTGPAVILYDPARTAEGTFRLQSTIFLFDPKDRLEAFGVFVGGRALDAPGQAYTYFLIRNDGRYLVKRRTGDTTTDLVSWTEHAAIKRYDPAAKESVRNDLAIEAGPDTVEFHVNGQLAAQRRRDEVDPDGIVGLRVNHHLNLHVSELQVERKASARR